MPMSQSHDRWFFFTVGYGYFVIGQMLRLKHFIYAAIRLPHRLHLEVVRGKVFLSPVTPNQRHQRNNTSDSQDVARVCFH